MTKFKVLFPIHPTTKTQDVPSDNFPEFIQFKKDFEVITKIYEDPKEMINDLQTVYSDVDAVFGGGYNFKIGGFDQFIEYLPSTVKVIGFPWVGSNMFSPEKLRARGIDLVNIGEISAHEVADIALSLTLSAFRYTTFFDKELRKNQGDITKTRRVLGSEKIDSNGEIVINENDEHNWTDNLLVGGNQLQSPNGKIAAMVGLGGIGKEIAKRLKAIGMKVQYTKRTPLKKEEEEKLGFSVKYFENFNELIKDADLIVFAVPHTPQTINLINENTLKLVKKGVRLVNIGRGTAIDEEALFKALDEGIVNSIGFDVFLNEPHIDKRFLNRPNVTILPHLGPFTVDNFRLSYITALNGIRTILTKDGKPVSIVN